MKMATIMYSLPPRTGTGNHPLHSKMMIKFSGLIDIDHSKKIHGTKYILSAAPDNMVALDGAELIPIDLGGKLVTEPPVSITELGKQLLKAAADGDIDEIKSLLTKGAPFTADWLGTSPLHLAAQNNHLEITEILLRAGISKDARTKVDRTPLHMAAYEGHLQIVDTLVKHGADIDCRDLLEMTPLHWAVQNGHLQLVEYLINNGARIDIQSKFGLTPLAIAQQIDRTDIEEYVYNRLTNSTVPTQNLVIQLAGDDVTEDNSANQDFSEDMELENSNHESIIIPIEPSMMSQFAPDNTEIEDELSQTADEGYFQGQDQDSIEQENEHLVKNVNVDTSHFSDSLKLLQEHGITMLQTDENEDGHILNSVMENGHSVVLTDIGKEVLNSVKQSEQQQQQQLQQQQQQLQQELQQQLQMEKKIVQVTPEEFLAMANGSLNHKNVFRQLKVLPLRTPVKRIVMKKNKVVPVTSVTSIRNDRKSPPLASLNRPSRTDMEMVMTQLIEARKTIEEYKIKLQKKEQEAERYKLQLRLLMDPS